MNLSPQNDTQDNFFRFPRLSEYAEAFSHIMRELKNIGASPGEIINLLKGTPDPPEGNGFGDMELELDLDIDLDLPIEPAAPAASTRQMYTAYQIAQELCIFSMYGRPHAHAVSAILNNIIRIGKEHKEERLLFSTENVDVWYTRYDEYAFERVSDWISDNELPYDIDGSYYTYHVRYYTL